MKLLTDKIPLRYRSMVRFFIVGMVGMFLQDGLYRWILKAFQTWWGEETGILAYIAFVIAFAIEMVFNYLISAWYTFRSKPTLSNAGGFVLARVLNLFIQFIFLHVLITVGVEEINAGFPSIFAAGIVNYFVLKVLFKPRNK